MSNQEPRDLVSNLAETLGAEHEELNQEKTAEVIAHLERVIANVPPATSSPIPASTWCWVRC